MTAPALNAPARPDSAAARWLRRLTRDCARHPWLVATILLVNLVGVAVDLSAPLVTKDAVDRATSGTGEELIPLLALLIGVLAVLRFGCQYGRRLSAGALALRVQNTLRLRILRAMHRLDGRSQDRVHTGQVVSRSISDLDSTYSFVSTIPFAAGAALQVVLVVGVMLWLSPLLTIITVLVVPTVIFVVHRTRKALFSATWAARQAAADVTQHVEETVTGVRVVKGFSQEGRAIGRLIGLAGRLFGERMRAARITARFSPTMGAVPQLGLVAVVALGGFLTMQGSVTVGTFLAFATYLTAITSLAQVLTNLVVVTQVARAGVQRVYQVVDQPADPCADATATLPRGPLGLRLHDVTFGHDPDEPPVLDGFDLTVRPGECVAVVGPPGSGKSTLTQLVGRFYRPDSGTVALTSATRAHDVTDLAPDALHGAVGIVFDDSFLFSSTIRDNIALGAAAATDAQVAEAAERAAARTFIEDLADGFATTVGERGMTLSGGQRQRITLARALLGDSRVLILDDATSAVDPVTEARILGELRRDENRTMLMLAHRRSTLEVADRVVVLDAGRIVDTGTVDELDERCALFRSLMSTEDIVEDDPVVPVHPTRAWPDGTTVAEPEQIEQPWEQPKVGSADLLTERPGLSLRRMLKPARLVLAVAITCTALDTVLQLVLPSLAREGVDSAAAQNATGLWWASTIGLAVVAVNWVVVALMTITTARAGERLLYGLRVRSYAHLQRLGLEYYEGELSGHIMTRMTTDVDALSSFLQNGLSTAVVSVLTVLGVGVALVVNDATLGALLLIGFIPICLATVVFRRISQRLYTRARGLVAQINASFQENLAGLRVNQAYRNTAATDDRFAALSGRYVRARMSAQQAVSVYFPFIGFVSDVASAFVIAIGGAQVARHEINPGVLVAFVLYLGVLFGPVQQLSQVFDGYQQARVSLRRIGELLSTETTVPDREGTEPSVARRFAGEVGLDRVTFGYRTANRPAVRGVSLHIPAGSSLALVGETGAGKSTLVKLLARFYDPVSGAVRMDGTDLRALPLTQYRSRLGVVPQEPHLFTGTVASNIAYGRPDATAAEITAAADAVGALEMIAQLPGGMGHPIGERGLSLSAGQRQLIALARAELVDPDLLLLDEATATLDQATERRVLAAGRSLARQRTSVLVAHRLASAARADRIAVVADGTIAELGTHEELLAAGGRYAQLWLARTPAGLA